MRKSLIALALMAAAIAAQAQRLEIDLPQWQFSKDKQQWQTVAVPHDWAIAGPFDKKWDIQTVAITQNGEETATEKTGRSGSLPWIGEGHYKTTVSVPQGYGKAMLVFDGAMAEPTVYVNGQRAGYWAYGYNTFRLDVTQLLHEGDNDIAVDLQNLEESSRWYPGAGLYRPVKLVLTQQTSLDSWTTSIRTQELTDQCANIEYQTVVQGAQGNESILIEVLNKDGGIETDARLDVPADGSISTTLSLAQPRPWSPETPYLYKVRTKLTRGGQTIDEQTLNMGVRTVSITAEGGFQLNGQTRKLQGVCLHHDLGPLGAAVNKAALIRQVKLMKDMGADAIRTSHNMPSQMQMDICDSLGMMVMAESFDMWEYPKCKNGYARFFNDWAERDITNLVLANRNHPAIVMWSIGNEIPEQGDKPKGMEWSKKLQDLCHQLDPTRTVTQGLDRVDNALWSGVAEVMDVTGLNYRTQKYDKAINTITHGVLLGSETASSVSSRGIYKLPYAVRSMANYPDGQCSAYDNEHCSWSNLPENDFEDMDDLDYTIGQFIWTGIDYLGEPTPYDEYWPSRSSYFGAVDLAGLPKDRFYLYRSVWNKQQHTLHIAPHWTWGQDMVGKTVPVQVYSDYDEAELFVNGKSQGRIKKHTAADNPNKDKVGKELYTPDLDRYRLRWMNVAYEPGELRVVAYDKQGQPAMEKTVRTAGEATQLVLSSDVAQLKADGNDLAFVTVALADNNGTMLPMADDPLEFFVEGAGSFKAVCNGDATSLEPFTEPRMKLFAGQLVVTVQAAHEAGTLRLTVRRPATTQDRDGKTVSRPALEQTIDIPVI